jgi:hypothetical protein
LNPKRFHSQLNGVKNNAIVLDLERKRDLMKEQEDSEQLMTTPSKENARVE